MASHGGYREPSNPAQVSGPGAMSQRTDGGQVNMDLPNAGYGENADFHDIQSGAPVAAAPHDNTAAMGLMSQLTPMGAPSSQPGTPVTDGAQYGPGSDQSVLSGMPNPNQDEAKALAASGVLKIMQQVADSDDATPSYRNYVRNIIANLVGN